MNIISTMPEGYAPHPFIGDAVADLENLSPLEEVAFPFLHCAVLLDRIRSGEDAGEVDFGELLESNALRWLEISNRSFSQGRFSDETRQYLGLAAQFMAQAMGILQISMDPKVIGDVINLNLNMSESILSFD